MTLQVSNVMEKYLRKAEDEKQPSKKTAEPMPDPTPKPKLKLDTGNANDPLGKHAKPFQNKVLVN